MLIPIFCCIDNDSSNLSSAKSSITGKVETVELDVSKIEEFEKLKSKVEKNYGGTFSYPLPASSTNANDLEQVKSISLSLTLGLVLRVAGKRVPTSTK